MTLVCPCYSMCTFCNVNQNFLTRPSYISGSGIDHSGSTTLRKIHLTCRLLSFSVWLTLLLTFWCCMQDPEHWGHWTAALRHSQQGRTWGWTGHIRGAGTALKGIVSGDIVLFSMFVTWNQYKVLSRCGRSAKNVQVLGCKAHWQIFFLIFGLLQLVEKNLTKWSDGHKFTSHFFNKSVIRMILLYSKQLRALKNN